MDRLCLFRRPAYEQRWEGKTPALLAASKITCSQAYTGFASKHSHVINARKTSQMSVQYTCHRAIMPMAWVVGSIPRCSSRVVGYLFLPRMQERERERGGGERVRVRWRESTKRDKSTEPREFSVESILQNVSCDYIGIGRTLRSNLDSRMRLNGAYPYAGHIQSSPSSNGTRGPGH
jgi:hypothetical protein